MNTSWWVLALAVVVHMALGVAWYSPRMFGAWWSELMDRTRHDERLSEERERKMRKLRFWSAITAAITAYVLASFITLVKIDTVSDAIQLGFWFWFGFVAPISFINTLSVGTSKRLWAIDAGYHLVSLILMGTIIVSLQ